MYSEAAMFLLLEKSLDLCEPAARHSFLGAIGKLKRLEPGKHMVIVEHIYMKCKSAHIDKTWGLKKPEIPWYDSLEEREAANENAAYRLGLSTKLFSHSTLDRLADAAIALGNRPAETQLSIAEELSSVVNTTDDVLDRLSDKS